MAIDGSLPLVRTRLLRTVNNERVSPDAVTATPTVEHVTTPGHHGYHDLRPVTSRADDDDPAVLYLDLVATDDADVNEAFAWRITFTNSDRPTRLVAVPQTGAAVDTIVTADGDEMPAVWLDALEDFSGYSGPTAPPSITQGYVDSALEVHEDAADPHPGYALETAVTTGLAGAVSTAAADAAAKVEAHRTATDPHGDRAAASTALESHRTATDPHGDRTAASTALTGHVQATDPHGDRAAAGSALEQHRTANDPHGDRAAATAAIETHRTATDPHGDRSAAATALEGHRTASDPHGDRAAASSDAASKVETHRTASDPHGDRAWATTQLAGKVDTTEADAAPGTASRRTLGTGANQALPGNHASVTNARPPLAHTHPASDLTATGTRSAGTFLRGDNIWAAVPTGRWTPRAVSADTTAAPAEALLVNATGGSRAVTPPATPAAGDRVLIVKTDTSSNPVTWTGTVSGDTGGVVLTAYAAAAALFYDGTTWWVETTTNVSGGTSSGGSSGPGPYGGVQQPAYAATVTPNAAVSSHHRYTATGNLLVNEPTGAVDGQSVTVEVQASGAQRTVTVPNSVELSEAAPSRTITVPAGAWGYLRLLRRSSTWRLVAADPLNLPGASDWTLADFGLLAWTAPPMTSSVAGPASGGVRMGRFKVANTIVVSTVTVVVATAGSGLVADQNALGIYDSSFNRLAVTGDQATAWATTGAKPAALTAAVTLPPNEYYAALLSNATTPPQFLHTGAPAVGTIGRSATNYLGVTGNAGVTALPASASIGGSTNLYWFGLS